MFDENMRSENDIFDLIHKIVFEDEKILAVYMNGSRTNSNVKKDIFQDYDVVFVVRDVSSFSKNPNWIKKIGNTFYMQLPDENPNFPSDKENFYGILVQFDDGVRMDIHFESLNHAIEHIKDDSLCKILIDKNNYLPSIPESSDKNYWINKPTEIDFLACCNEFWWCTNNLAKGLWRKEILYVQDMANFVVRKQLEKMLSWKAGLKNNFSVSVGKSAKYLQIYIDETEYNQYLQTFFTCDIESAWKCIFLMCDLFEKISVEVANQLGYLYNFEEAKNAREFLERVRKL